MKRQLIFASLSLLLVLISCKSSSKDPFISSENERICNEFIEICKRNTHKVDSIKSTWLLTPDYKYDIVGRRRSYYRSNYKIETPYYGKANGGNAIVFSLHFKDKKQITIFRTGLYNYSGIDDFGNFYDFKILNYNLEIEIEELYKQNSETRKNKAPFFR